MAHVSECLAVVTDPTMDQYGDEAEMLWSDQSGDGMVGLKFADGGEAVVNDGQWATHPDIPQVRIFLKTDIDAIAALKARLPEIREQLKEHVVPWRYNDPREKYDAALEARKRFVAVLYGAVDEPKTIE